MHLPALHANQHEAATADVPRVGMHDCKRKAGGHRGINRITASLHHLNTCLGSQLVLADDHCMQSMLRMEAAARYALVGEQDKNDDRQCETHASTIVDSMAILEAALHERVALAHPLAVDPGPQEQNGEGKRLGLPVRGV